MKNSHFASCAINAVALFLLAAAGTPAIRAASEVRFQLVHDALIVVPVTADGEGPFYFLLDTGADTTIVDTGVAKKLSLAAVGAVKQTTVTGSQSLNLGLLDRLTVGQAHVEKLPVLEEDLSSLRRIDGRIVGIVGQDFLCHFNYLLNYRERTLRIEEGDDLRRSIEGEAVVVEVGENNRMIIAAEAQSREHTKLRLLLDSGANALVLMGPVASALHSTMGRQGTETSSAGSAAMRTGRVDVLKVASREFRDVQVALMADRPAGQIADGLLPTMFFEGLYVNNHDGFVILNPRAKKMLNVALR